MMPMTEMEKRNWLEERGNFWEHKTIINFTATENRKPEAGK